MSSSQGQSKKKTIPLAKFMPICMLVLDHVVSCNSCLGSGVVSNCSGGWQGNDTKQILCRRLDFLPNIGCSCSVMLTLAVHVVMFVAFVAQATIAPHTSPSFSVVANRQTGYSKSFGTAFEVFMQASMRQHSVASQRADSDAETRLAKNGRRYTKAEFIEYYTYDGQRIWDQLPRATDLDRVESHRIRQMQQRDADDQMRNPGWTVTNGIWQQRTTPGDRPDAGGCRCCCALGHQIAGSDAST